MEVGPKSNWAGKGTAFHSGRKKEVEKLWVGAMREKIYRRSPKGEGARKKKTNKKTKGY